MSAKINPAVAREKFLRRQAKKYNHEKARRSINSRLRRQNESLERMGTEADIETMRLEERKAALAYEAGLKVADQITDEAERGAAIAALQPLRKIFDRWMPDAAATERRRKAAEKMRELHQRSEEQKKQMAADRQMRRQFKLW